MKLPIIVPKQLARTMETLMDKASFFDHKRELSPHPGLQKAPTTLVQSAGVLLTHSVYAGHRSYRH